MKEKELIELIADRLKDLKEPEYRKGSWENFKSNNASKRPAYVVGRMWYAAASLLLLAGFGWMYLLPNKPFELVTERSVGEHSSSGEEARIANTSIPETVILPKENHEEQKTLLDEGSMKISKLTDPLRTGDLNQNNIVATQQMQIPQILKMEAEALRLSGSLVNLQNDKLAVQKFNGTDHVLAISHDPLHTMKFKAVEESRQMKNIRLADKIELGLYVSPYATAQNMNFGGGFTLGYQLTKGLSVRTGLAYSSFEMNQIKNPIEVSSVETVSASNAINADVSDSYNGAAFSRFQSTVVVPNVNAIRGFVKSLDVPVEFKLHASKSFYAVAGVSYSAILNQQRNAYYVDNMNANTFEDSFPETYEQAAKAVQVVTKNIESSEQNVNTNGFSGFVNFSVGKTVRLTNRMGVSVEPYYRIPVGQFRRTDMNYSNGGIRIMTNF